MSIKLCENIGIFIKNYKSTNPGSNIAVYGPCEQESKEKKFKILIFQYAKPYIVKNKLLVKIYKKKNYLRFFLLLVFSSEIYSSRRIFRDT